MPILINALKDEHDFVRSEAADQLGSLGKGEAIPHLQLLLNDSDPQVRESAQNAIEYIETELAIERIMEKGSPDEQDALVQLLEDALASERRWDEAFARSQDALAKLADQALAEYRTLNSKNR